MIFSAWDYQNKSIADAPQKTLFSLPDKQKSHNRQTIQNGIF